MKLNEFIQDSSKVEDVEEVGRIYKINLKGSLSGKELFLKIIKKENGKFEPYMSYFVGSKPSDWYAFFGEGRSYEETLRLVLGPGLGSYKPDLPREDHRTYENTHYNDY